MLIQELEFIKQKRGSPENVESSRKAKLAINNLIKPISQGGIVNGIPIESGWIIGVPSPRKDAINPELEQLEDVVSAFKRADAKLLLLTRECHQVFESLPVTLLTGDQSFFIQVEMQGIPCHLTYTFPIEGLKEATALSQPINWKQVIDGIETNTKQTAITVEATLTGKRLADQWLALISGTKRFVVAEGRGVMRASDSIQTFLWTIIFYPQSIYPRPAEDDEGLVELPMIYLDFLGEDEPSQELFDAIADRLISCAQLSFEEGTPTLQNPESIMEILLYLEYLMRKGPSENSLEDLKQEIKKSDGLVDYWTDWIVDIQDEAERYACLEGLFEALNEYWEIGQTYTFSIITG